MDGRYGPVVLRAPSDALRIRRNPIHIPMPEYSYRCRKCEALFSRREKMSEHGTSKVPCPECRSTDTESVLSAAYPRLPRKS